MMSRRKEMTLIAAGMLAGAMLVPTAHAAAQYLTATPSAQRFYVDGAPARLEAYIINGNNYVKLRDIGEAVGFNVGYDGSTNSVYIGEQLNLQDRDTVTIPTDGSRYIPQTGDRIQCDDGCIYEIKDVSRYDSNVFAEGPVGPLPTPTCDWSAFPARALPQTDIRHFSDQYGDDLFVRNLYETRRMEYTIYNALGKEPSAWGDGKPLAAVQLTIRAEDEAYTNSFWPWRSLELEKLVHSRPNSRYYVEAWDYYHNGVFQYTRYSVVSE